MTNNKKGRMFRFQTVRLAAVSTVVLATAACGSDSASSPDTSPPVAEPTASPETTPIEAPTSDSIASPEASDVPATQAPATQAPTPPATAAQAETDDAASGPVIVIQPPEFAEEAAGEGTLFLQDDCLLFSAPDGEVSAVAWPDGTTWDASSESVLSTSGAVIPMGQLFSAGGGFHTADTVGAFVIDPDAVAEVTRCANLEASDGSIFVIQSPVDL